MLITFKTDAHADITMFGDIALNMIEMMGHSRTVPGAILAEDVPTALFRLKAAIEEKKANLPVEEVEETEDGNDENEPKVSIDNRALPLISLLSAASEAECNVMWDENSPLV